VNRVALISTFVSPLARMHELISVANIFNLITLIPFITWLQLTCW
jgi:hypothetical protein